MILRILAFLTDHFYTFSNTTVVAVHQRKPYLCLKICCRNINLQCMEYISKHKTHTMSCRFTISRNILHNHQLLLVHPPDVSCCFQSTITWNTFQRLPMFYSALTFPLLTQLVTHIAFYSDATTHSNNTMVTQNSPHIVLFHNRTIQIYIHTGKPLDFRIQHTLPVSPKFIVLIS